MELLTKYDWPMKKTYQAGAETTESRFIVCLFMETMLGPSCLSVSQISLQLMLADHPVPTVDTKERHISLD